MNKSLELIFGPSCKLNCLVLDTLPVFVDARGWTKN